MFAGERQQQIKKIKKGKRQNICAAYRLLFQNFFVVFSFGFLIISTYEVNLFVVGIVMKSSHKENISSEAFQNYGDQ